MKRMGTRLLPVLLCALLTLTACGGGSNSAASRPADNNMVSTDSAPQAGFGRGGQGAGGLV